MDNERLGVVEERLENFVSQMPALQQGVQKILEDVGAIKLTVATMPTWDSVKPMQAEHKAEIAAANLRITALETRSAQISAGAKTLVFLGTTAGVFIGWAISLYSK